MRFLLPSILPKASANLMSVSNSCMNLTLILYAQASGPGIGFLTEFHTAFAALTRHRSNSKRQLLSLILQALLRQRDEVLVNLEGDKISAMPLAEDWTCSDTGKRIEHEVAWI